MNFHNCFMLTAFISLSTHNNKPNRIERTDPYYIANDNRQWFVAASLGRPKISNEKKESPNADYAVDARNIRACVSIVATASHVHHSDRNVSYGNSTALLACCVYIKYFPTKSWALREWWKTKPVHRTPSTCNVRSFFLVASCSMFAHSVRCSFQMLNIFRVYI